MHMPRWLNRGVIVAFAGIVILAMVVVASSYVHNIRTVLLRDILPFDDVILYTQSEKPLRIENSVLLWNGAPDNTLKIPMPTEGWYEYALVRKGSGGMLTVLAQNGRVTWSTGKSESLRKIIPHAYSLSRMTGMERFIETNPREVRWFDTHNAAEGEVSAMMKATLFGGTSILVLPDSNGREGRMYVRDGVLPIADHLASRMKPDPRADISLVLPSALEFAKQWIVQLRSSHAPLAEGLSGILQARLQSIDASTLSLLLERVVRIDLYRGEGVMHFIIQGSSAKREKATIFSLLANEGNGVTRTITDDNGHTIREDLAIQTATQETSTKLQQWTTAATPYSSLTDTPLFLGSHGERWVMSDDEALLRSWIEEDQKNIDAGRAYSSGLQFHGDMEGGSDILQSLLSYLGKEIADSLTLMIGTDIASIDFSIEPVGEGFMMRWNMARTSDVLPTLLPYDQEPLVK